jgi:hypothetical protein
MRAKPVDVQSIGRASFVFATGILEAFPLVSDFSPDRNILRRSSAAGQTRDMRDLAD